MSASRASVSVNHWSQCGAELPREPLRPPPDSPRVWGMATYAIGDVQGCYDSLMALVSKLELGDDDRLWFVGDLVNRGPRSVDVLRWVRDMGDRCVTVLGNHDLHFLAMVAGLRKPKGRDTAQQVLDEPDAEELIDWLRQRPLLHLTGKHVLVHASLHPQWSCGFAAQRASELENVLRADDWREQIVLLRGGAKEITWRNGMEGAERLQALASIFTKARCLRCDEDEWTVVEDFVGPPSEAPEDLVPWFDVPASMARPRVIFGHWAALGLLVRDGHLGLDTGCVWGRELTAVRLDDDEVFAQPAID